jgi:hypothetical protein
MFGMFGGKKGKKTGGKGGNPPVSGQNAPAGGAAGKTREQIIAEAQANARKAREEIGAENLNRMMEAILREGKTLGAKARNQIRGMDPGKVSDHVKLMLDDEED